MVHTIYDTAILAVGFEVTPELPPGANGFLRILNWILWIVTFACVAAVIVSGGKFAWEKWSRGESDAVKMLLGSLGGAVVAGSAVQILNAVTA
ncbi:MULTISPECIES: hypothetical protein [Rhodococcus erythropolis group]|uniref:Uncharacterized protein n=1 Tax=Rhodococcus erythropolis TaxID=1833 RepID=A0A8I0ZZH4_RHOER|nr:MULTISPECIES: hypothetical protein [Rhodococcus erythropolis group]MBH5144252.1 hypothetical protein [Rhodococcus erythropolis]MDJ0434708.1 hypothetical protein [Rhodococcus qingshengii]QEM25712.1 hypothetical protein D6M20_02400 [Rhodococcus qingshengii]